MIADMLSHLIDIVPDIVLEPELKEYEFGSYCFETLPKARSLSVSEKLASVDGVDVCEISITYDNGENLPNSVEMPLCLMKNFLNYRLEIRKYIISESESAMANIQTSTRWKIMYYTVWWLKTTINLMQLSFQPN